MKDEGIHEEQCSMEKAEGYAKASEGGGGKAALDSADGRTEVPASGTSPGKEVTGKVGRQKLEGYKHYCPRCGKEFWAFADWQFRRRVKGKKNKAYYCSYKCVREVEREEKK